MIDKSFVQKCQAFIEPNRFRLDEPMKLHTTFKIGGPADCLIFPASMEETEKVLALDTAAEVKAALEAAQK